MHLHRPTGPLGNHVRLIWCLDHDHGTQSPCALRLVPSGCMELTVHYGQPPALQHGSRSTELPHGVVTGQRLGPTELTTGRRVGLVSAMLRPGSGAALLGLPALILQGDHVCLSDVFARDGERLVEQIGEADGSPERVAILEAFLLRRLRESSWSVDERVVECVRKTTSVGGRVSVPMLAKGACLGRRQLERLFAAHVGYSPRTFARVVRFQYALSVAPGARSLARLAYDAGFADQSHFIREVKALSGDTPGALLGGCPPRSDYYEFL